MTTSITDHLLLAEVSQMIHEFLDAGKICKPGWLVQEWIDQHPNIRGTDADMYIRCAYEHGRHLVRRALREFSEEPEVETEKHAQITLPGFERMRKGYLVIRDEEEALVPTNLCSKSELVAKAEQYEKMAEGCIAHAKELRRYIGQRF